MPCQVLKSLLQSRRFVRKCDFHKNSAVIIQSENLKLQTVISHTLVGCEVIITDCTPYISFGFLSSHIHCGPVDNFEFSYQIIFIYLFIY